MKKTILVVEDDPDFLTQTELCLQSAGFEVKKAESEKEGRERIKQGGFDLAILDLMLENPDSGFVLSHLIKKHMEVPVILVTAVTQETGMHFDNTTKEERSWVKADTILQKDIRFEQLLGEINRLLEK